LKKWTYFRDRDELRYAGSNNGEVVIIIDLDDIEIYINENGEINEIAIYNASKYLDENEIKQIADIALVKKEKHL